MKKNIELIHLEYLNKRRISLDASKKRKLKYLTRGYQGEAEFLLWFKQYGSEHALVLPNYWFHDGKTMETDFLIITEGTWYAVDVKNFAGKFVYKNEECWLNDYLLDENFFHSMSTRVRKLQRIASEVSHGIKVVGVMAFINEHCQVEVDCQVDFDIVFRNQLKNYLTNIKQYRPLPADYIMLTDSVLSRYKTISPFRPIGLKPEEFAQLRKGICCPHCHSFEHRVTRNFVQCIACDYRQSKHEAVLEAVRDLRHVFIDNEEMLTATNVLNYMNQMVKRRTVNRVLASHFPKISGGPATYYKVDL